MYKKALKEIWREIPMKARYSIFFIVGFVIGAAIQQLIF